MAVDGTKVTIAALERGLLIETGIKHTFVVEGPTIRLVNVEAPTFVPGEETTAISYAIDGPVSQADLVQLKVWSAPPKGERVAVALVDIAGPYSANGKFEWNGSTDKFGKVITLKGSPYEVEFVLQTKTGSLATSNVGKIQLAIEKIKIVVDAPSSLVGVGSSSKPALDGLITDLKNSGMPGDCEGRLVIDSPVFKIDEGEMMSPDSFTEYKSALGNGHAVPLLAEITLKSKAGGGKRAPDALIGTRVLWDFKLEASGDLDGSLGARGVLPGAKAFIKKVASYEEAATQPKGVSAHMKAGGWRAKSADREAVGRQWGSAGSWTLTAPTTRDWSALTACGKDGFVDGDSGVFFLPGRMAGDTHRLRAVVDVDEALDVADEAAPDGAPAAHRSNTINIVNGRRIPIVGNWIVGTGTVPVNIPPLTEEFKKAGMLIELAAGVAVREVGATWRTAYRAGAAEAARAIPFLQDALETEPGAYAVRYREFMDYWQRTNSQAGFFGRLWERVRNFFGAGDEAKYKKLCDKNWYEVLYRAGRHLRLPEHGLTALKFGTTGPHNQNPKENKYTAGVAPAIHGLISRSKAIFFQFTKSTDTETFVHEVGHLLFLAHAPSHLTPAEDPEDYLQIEGHDKDQICIMSYDPGKQHLCGLCLLKIAGWNAYRIWSDGRYDS